VLGACALLVHAQKDIRAAGLRRGELLKLRWASVDFNRRLLTCEGRKPASLDAAGLTCAITSRRTWFSAAWR